MLNFQYNYKGFKDKNQSNLRLVLRKLAFCFALALILFSFPVLIACKTEELSSLREFSHPYTGEYVCKEGYYGDLDLLEKFRQIVLTLQPSGEFSLCAESKSGKTARARGNYQWNDEGTTLTLSVHFHGKTYRKTCPVTQGKFVLSDTLGGKTFVLKFENKG